MVLRYFDDYSKWKDDLNFSTARTTYSSAMRLGCSGPTPALPRRRVLSLQEPGT